MNIPEPSPRDLEMLGRLESEYEVADRFSSGSVEAKHIRLIAFLRSRITTLTEENKRLHDEAEVSDSLVLTLQEEVKMLTTERDEARKSLAELRSAPDIEDVDAAKQRVLMGIGNPHVSWASVKECVEFLASIARRAIASRDEVVGLLKWWVSFKDGFGQLEGMSAGSAVEEWKDNARRILEIVEGK